MEKYDVYRLGKFSDIQQEKVAIFFDIQLAKNFVEYHGAIGERFGVFDENGNRLDEE